MSEANKSHERVLSVKVPKRIADATERAIEHLAISHSAFIRQAMVNKLEADGFLTRDKVA
jgi:hypothetical protein